MDLTKIKAVLEAIENPTAELKSAISDIETFYNEASATTSKFEDLQKELDEAKTDLMMEKGKRKKAESRIDEWKETAEDHEKKLKDLESLGAEVETLKSENETLKTYKIERDTAIRNDYQKRLDEYSKKEAFEKVKSKIVIPSDEKKLEDLAIEEIVASNKELDIATEYGLFGASGSQTPKDAGDGEEEEAETMEILDAMGTPRPKK